MKRSDTIKKSEDFDKIINQGKNFKNEYYRIFILPKEENIPKMGLAIGKSVGNAVKRNYVKRKLRAIISNNKFLFKNNYNYIIMVRKAFLTDEYKNLEKGLKELLEKVN